MKKVSFVLPLVLVLTLNLFAQKNNKTMNDQLAVATFGNGCFWCTEAIFQQLKGVKTVLPGYTGGEVKNPSYKAVCAGTTGHAEAIQITYDPSVISFRELLDVFFYTHDPTTLNRQVAMSVHSTGRQSFFMTRSNNQMRLKLLNS